jgi:hypothetical protein
LASFYYLSIIFCNCSDCVVFIFFHLVPSNTNWWNQ